jgi:mannose-6-phosphate isomerase-like protein (cupin superfamily)
VDNKIDVVPFRAKLAEIQDHWNPRVAAELNGQMVKLVKFLGEFVWHKHDHEDEMFLVVRGRFRMELRDRTLEIGEGQLIVIPRGVEHRPVADEEVDVMLFEPATTLNTGDAVGDRRTRPVLDRI